MNPIYTKLLVLGIALALGFCGGTVWKDRELSAYKLEVAKEQATQLSELSQAKDRATKAEHDALATVSAISKKYRQGELNAKADYEKRIAAIRSGELRLSVPVTDCPPVTDTADAGAITGVIREARCRLSDRAAEFLTGFAARCNAEVAQRNQLSEQYQAVKAKLEQAQTVAW